MIVRRALAALAVLALSAGARSDNADERMLSNAADGTNWPAYGRLFDESHYSPLAEISDANVGRLGLAWSYDLPQVASVYTAPLAVDGVLYFAVGYSLVHAMDARTGKLLWVFDPNAPEAAGEKLRGAWGIRGIAYWHGKIYVGTIDGRLIAVDARSGKPVWSVMTMEKDDGRYISGAPRVFAGKVIIGFGGSDYQPSRGYVTTYDAETGKLLWRFYTVPGDPAKGFESKALERAAKTWKGKWWQYGGAGGSVWNSITYDPEYNRIYIGTGNGTPWNQKVRSPGGGDNLYLCSIVALDADTGQYVWHYQINPGETWDYNAAMDIQLATLNIGGRPRKVLMQAPKNGFFYVIDRDTGKPISAEKIVPVNWAERIDLKTGRPMEIAAARYPGKDGAIVRPGSQGAHSSQPSAYSPATKLVYIPVTDSTTYYNDAGIDPATWHPKLHMFLNRAINRIPSPLPPPPVSSALLAWDPARQIEAWRAPLTGTANGGVMATGGNLVFQGRADGQFVAYAASSGKPLWRFDGQAGIIGQPITYTAGGRQYVTVIAGYGGQSGIFGAEFGWEYRSHKRRVLTFALDGKAQLPPAEPHVKAFADDPGFVVDPAKAAAGKAIFGEHCHLCHGRDLIAGGTAPDLRESPIPLSIEAMTHVVTDGALVPNGMPRFAEFGPAEVTAIQHYIRQQARTAIAAGKAARSTP